MTDQRDTGAVPAAPAKRSGTGGIGCLAGIGTAIALPALVLAGMLIANRMNPDCGTPGDSGGCEMGVAAATIVAAPFGIVLGIIVWIVVWAVGAGRRPRAPKK
jgi:hypothetical protein